MLRFVGRQVVSHQHTFAVEGQQLQGQTVFCHHFMHARMVSFGAGSNRNTTERIHSFALGNRIFDAQHLIGILRKRTYFVLFHRVRKIQYHVVFRTVIHNSRFALFKTLSLHHCGCHGGHHSRQHDNKYLFHIFFLYIISPFHHFTILSFQILHASLACPYSISMPFLIVAPCALPRCRNSVSSGL